LHNCGEAYQRHENFEQITKPAITHKPINEVKANCAHHDDDQYVYEQEKHGLSPDLALTRIPR
jgi:hypothetical protein